MRPSKQDSAQDPWVARLCPQCGLCCNGVLFADVKLVRGDNALLLEKAGLKLVRSGERSGFDQPCSCLDGSTCRIYDQRPKRCRQFDCHTLKQARRGELSERVALRRIQDAKAEAEHVRSLLTELGQRDEQLPLAKRYRSVMSEPVDLALGEDHADKRGELMLAVNDLMHRLESDFLG